MELFYLVQTLHMFCGRKGNYTIVVEEVLIIIQLNHNYDNQNSLIRWVNFKYSGEHVKLCLSHICKYDREQ